MKTQKFLSSMILFILILVITLVSSLIITSRSIDLNDKINYYTVKSWKYTDSYGNTFEAKTTIITILNVRNMNFTHYFFNNITQSVPYSNIISINNGGWSQELVEGLNIKTHNNQEFKNDFDPIKQYIILKILDYPTWDNDTAGLEYREWNTSDYYVVRYDFFDKLDDDYADECEIEINPVLFTDDPTEFINKLERQWYAMVYGDQTGIPRITWNVTKEPWNVFRAKLFKYIAYSPTILSTNSITGDIELIEFRPEWIGDYWYPNQFEKWTGTEWVARSDFNINRSATTTPLDGSKALKDYLKFYGPKSLTQRRIQLSNAMRNLDVNFGTKDYSISFEIKILDLGTDLSGTSIFTYHNPNQISWGKRDLNNGILKYENKAEYDPTKSCLKYYKETKIFDFSEHGNYSEIVETRMLTDDEISSLLKETSETGDGIPSFELSIVSIAIVFFIIYRKKKH